MMRRDLCMPNAEPEPVAWVDDLSRAQPHCVTDLRYCSVGQWERGEHLRYVPVFAGPPQPRESVRLTEEDIQECLPLGIAAYSTLVGEEKIYRFARAVEDAVLRANNLA